MRRGIISPGIPTLAVALAMVLQIASPVQSAKTAKDAAGRDRVIDPRINRMVQYSFPDESVRHTVGAPAAGRNSSDAALGSLMPADAIGTAVGNTWYDYQHNGAIGRMIENHTGVNNLVHFSWTYLPGPAFDAREYAYDNYNVSSQSFGAEVGLQSDDDYGGFVNLAVTNDNRAVVGGHNTEPQDGTTDPHFYWDFAEGGSFFGATYQVPSALQHYGQTGTNDVIWPKFVYVEGADTVLHVLAKESNGSAAGGLYYFRRTGSDTDPSATWTSPPRIIDSIYLPSYSIDASDDGKVGIAWTALLPCDPSDPDTASGVDCRQFVQWDNDVYYQLSYDYGVTWQPRVNLTNNILTEGQVTNDFRMFRPYTETSVLLDSQDYLHIAWNAMYWPADANNGGDAGLNRGQIFHWSEDMPYVRTAHGFNWDQTTCAPGAFNLTAADLSISECDGRFYILFTQFNNIPGGVEDDCAIEDNPGFPSGAANGDLFVVMSPDGGLSWSQANNITQTYTPGCDSVGGAGGPCASESYGSMAKFGTNQALAPGDTVLEPIIVPGATDNGWYLDAQFILDPSAGAIVHTEGFWQQAEVRWFRLGCYSLYSPPPPHVDPRFIEYPTYVLPCQQLDLEVTITNFGTEPLPYSLILEEDYPGGYDPGWLAVSGASGTVGSGTGNTETFIIHLNAGGVVCDIPGQIISLVGRVIIDFGGPDPGQVPIEINVPVVDQPPIPPIVDTISTTCLSLGVVNNGSFGRQGAPRIGMDFQGAGDCDTTALTYLYDGSPFVGWVDEGTGDTVMNWSIFGTSYLDPVGLVQVTGFIDSSDSRHQILQTNFLTHDSTIMLEKTWYAPQAVDTCKFIIQRLRVWSNDSLDHTGITVGEAVDWDVPSDSGSDNGSGFDAARDLIYTYGGEYDQDDSTECLDNDQRYAGMISIGYVRNAYTASNADYVYGNDDGFVPGELYAKIDSVSGFQSYSSPDPDSQFVDLHMVMTYVHKEDLLADDTLVFWTALMTEYDGGLTGIENTAQRAREWICATFDPPGCGCCQLRGDVNCTNTVNVSDLTTLVDYLFRDGYICCEEQGDVNCDGQITVSDLTYIIGFFFRSGPAPCPCDCSNCSHGPW